MFKKSLSIFIGALIILSFTSVSYGESANATPYLSEEQIISDVEQFIFVDETGQIDISSSASVIEIIGEEGYSKIIAGLNLINSLVEEEELEITENLTIGGGL
jgi:hypothetical protein